MSGELGPPVATTPHGTPWTGPLPSRGDGWSLEEYEYDPKLRRSRSTYARGSDVVVVTRNLK